MLRSEPDFDDPIRAAAILTHDLDAFEGDERFDAITGFAAALLGTPIALVTLLEQDRQRHLSKVGTDLCEAPLSMSLCVTAIQNLGLTIVPDTTRDPRFADNPVVTGDLHIRFYAGAPLLTADGVALGTLCVLDTEARGGLSPLQVQGLTTLAASVSALLRARRENRALRESEVRWRTLADALPHLVWVCDANGQPLWVNQRWIDTTGTGSGLADADDRSWLKIVHPDDHAAVIAAWRAALAETTSFECEFRLLHAGGEPRWTMARAVPFVDVDQGVLRWFGTCTDTHAHRLAIEERELISNELSHRIKNIFAVVTGLIHAAARASDQPAALPTGLIERVAALGRAHDFVRPRRTGEASERITLHGLLGRLFEPYREGDRERVVLAGGDLAIDERATTPLSLLFHELATNAAKYGALSVAEGHVALACTHDDETLTIEWREEGGPPVEPPTATEGFGTRLIETSAVRQLRGTLEREWRGAGLVVAITMPLESLRGE